MCCGALGGLRLVEALRWRGAAGGRLSELQMGLDAGWAVLSVVVIMLAPSDAIRGVAIWFALGTLGSWLLVRKGYLLQEAQAHRRAGPLPDWYQEYMLGFGAGLTGFSLGTLLRYSPADPLPLSHFGLQASGVLCVGFLLVTVLRAVLLLVDWGLQRNLDRVVLGGLREHPQCLALFGNIERVMCKPEESARYEHDDVLVYRVEGSLARGVVVAEFRAVNESFSEVVQGLVYMDSGERTSLNAGSAAVKPASTKQVLFSNVSELPLNY